WSGWMKGRSRPSMSTTCRGSMEGTTTTTRRAAM
ncbi:hypothetical protein AB1N83_013551, partial [Pleurotus pulmonarius]